MEFLSVLHSDVGIRKKTNQDSVLIKEAMTDYGRIMLAVICDGMGGLAKGEIASASLIRAFLSWFEKDFPEILYNERNKEGIRRDVIEDSLNALVLDVNKKIAAYAQQHHITMGTTAAVLLGCTDICYVKIFIMPPIKNSMQTEVQQQKVLMMIPQTDSANYILRN